MYVYQEFPRVMYHRDREPRLAQNTEEKERLLEQGFELQPIVGELEDDPDGLDPIVPEDDPSREADEPRIKAPEDAAKPARGKGKRKPAAGQEGY